MIDINHGNDHKITYSLTDSLGAPKDLTGTQSMKFAMTAGRWTSPAVQYTLDSPELTILDAAGGVVEVSLPRVTVSSLEPRVYYLELWQVNALGQASTLVEDTVHVKSKIIKE